MKRKGNIFDKITTIENIAAAHEMAKRDKSKYKEVEEVEENPLLFFEKIKEMLENQTYEIKESDYRLRKKVDKGKVRDLMILPYYPHRIIQWAVILQIQDILLKRLIPNTYASLPGRGIQQAHKRLEKALKSDELGTKYCYKMDIKKYYPSINRDIAKNQWRSFIKDNKLLWLIDLFIDTAPGTKGIPIGSLFSQWEGNLFASPLDRFIKEELKVKYYFRYCDDIVILHSDKVALHNIREKIAEFLKSELDLEVKDNHQIFPVACRGIDFVGYRHFHRYTLLRKTIASNMIKRSKYIRKNKSRCSARDCNSLISSSGWAKHCDGHNLISAHFTPLGKLVKNKIRGAVCENI